MSSFRKVNLSQEELNKNPYKVSAQPSTAINKSEEKNKPQEDINVNDSRDVDRDITPSQQHFENKSQDETPPGDRSCNPLMIAALAILTILRWIGEIILMI